MRRISSSLTHFYKYGFFYLWTGTFGFGTFMMFMPFSKLSSSEKMLLGPPFVLAWIFGTALLYYSIGRINEVFLDGRTLHISNFKETIKVDLSEVASVSGFSAMAPEQVCLKLRNPTKFGKAIYFMPRMRFHLGCTKHPIVYELRELIKDATRSEKDSRPPPYLHK